MTLDLNLFCPFCPSSFEFQIFNPPPGCLQFKHHMMYDIMAVLNCLLLDFKLCAEIGKDGEMETLCMIPMSNV